MKEEALISKQALRIAELEESLLDRDERLGRIHLMLVSIGGPLNDNVLRFNPEQRQLLHLIDEEAVTG